jgi:glycyl-tRNA synthetase alpha chain
MPGLKAVANQALGQGNRCRGRTTLVRTMKLLRAPSPVRDCTPPAGIPLFARDGLPIYTRGPMKPPRLGSTPRTFQELIFALERYWADQGCVILEPYDMEVGCRHLSHRHVPARHRPGALERRLRAAVAPADRRALRRQSLSPAALLPVPGDHQALAARYPRYLSGQPAALGLDPLVHDVRFVEDNWESPTLGAWGLGWEVWLNGMEIIAVHLLPAGGRAGVPPGERGDHLRTRAARHVPAGRREHLRHLCGPRARREASPTATSSTRMRWSSRPTTSSRRRLHVLLRHFVDTKKPAQDLLAAGLALPAYEQLLKASHTFNLLDARHAISVTERQSYLLRVRTLGARCGAGLLTKAARRSAFRC